MTNRYSLLVTGTVASLSCSIVDGPDITGGIILQVGSLESTGSGAPLDSVLVIVDGPSHWEVTVQPETTVKSDSLLAGSYQVALVGFAADQVDAFGLTTVTVIAGQNSDVTGLAWSDFFATIDPLDTPTTDPNVSVSWSPVEHADAYVVEWDIDPAFLAPARRTVDGETTTIAIDELGEHFVRVRAVNEFAGEGRPSDVSSVLVVTELRLEFSQQPVSGEAGAPLLFGVRALDSLGNVDAGFVGEISLAITTGTGTRNANLRGTLRKPADSGEATFDDVSIDLVGTGYSLTAIAEGRLDGVSAEFDVAPAPASVLTFSVEPSDTTAGVPFPQDVAVTARDSLGNVAVDFEGDVTLAITDGTGVAGATLRGTVTQPAVQGVATFSGLSVDRAGTQFTLTASASDLIAGVSAPFSISAAPASALSFTVQPVTSTAGVPFTPEIAVTVQDSVGNVITDFGDDITLALAGGPSGAALRGTTTVAASSGVATFPNVSVDSAGTGYSLSASVDGLDVVISNPFDIVAGPANSLAFTSQPVSADAGASLPNLTVAVRDSMGNVAASFSSAVSLVISPGSGKTGANLRGVTTVGAVRGIASFDDISIDSVGTTYTLMAMASGLPGVTSAPFDINSAPPIALLFAVEPTDATAGAAITPTVRVVAQDSLGNVAASFGSDVTISMTGGTPGATLRGTTTVTAVGGIVDFPGINVDSTGTGYTLAAAGGGLISSSSASFDIGPGPVASLTFTVQPNTTAVGAVMAPAVSVIAWDSLGNPATGFVDPVTLAIAAGTGTPGATLGGTTTVNAAAGVATFGDLAIDLPGVDYAFVASAGAITSPPSAVFDVMVGFRSVSAGNGFTCANGLDDRIYCWGLNDAGQLGDGTVGGSRTTPAAMTGGLTFDSLLAAGGQHACAFASDNDTYCWGSDDAGQVGNGGDPAGLGPTPVEGAGLPDFTSLSSGAAHACGVGGDFVFCWGETFGDHPEIFNPPTTFSSVTSGGDHTCAVSTVGSAAQCWGQNNKGQLGDGTTTPSVTVPVAVTGGLSFASLSAGNEFTCGITTDGLAYCWGRNTSGQLGGGSGVDSLLAPAAVSGGLQFSSISAGGTHACGIVSGVVYCWGLNTSGQLGDGTNVTSSTPVQTSSSLQFASVSAGLTHTCGVTTEGALYCWGENSNGELGIGSAGSEFNSNVPVLVRGSVP